MQFHYNKISTILSLLSLDNYHKPYLRSEYLVYGYTAADPETKLERNFQCCIVSMLSKI